MLLKEAAEMFTKSLSEAITKSGGNGTVALSNFVNDIISEFNEKGWIQKFLDWWFSKKRNEEKRNNFMKTLTYLFRKLERNKQIIGRSLIIGGLVERWKEDVAIYNNEYLYEKYFNNSQKIEEGVGCGLTLFFLFGIVILIASIFIEWNFSVLGGIIAIPLLILLTYWLYTYSFKIRYYKSVKRDIMRYTRLADYFFNADN